MTDDEYAIVSKKEFMQLKRELERLKKNPLDGSESGENLQSSIDNLNKSLNVMLEVFKQAADDMKLEEHDSEAITKYVEPLNEKLETLIDQNQKIAKGIVAVADMVKEKLEEIEEKTSAPPKLPPLKGGPAPRAPSPVPPPGPAPIGGMGGMNGPSFDDDLPPLGGRPPPSGAPMPPPPGGSFPPPPGGPMPSSGDPSKKDIMSGLMR